MSWRNSTKIHPAADAFPLLSDEDLVVMGNDIRTNGHACPIAIAGGTSDVMLLDGRNRLDAMERVGLRVSIALNSHGTCHVIAKEHREGEWLDLQLRGTEIKLVYSDPAAFVVSANINR